MTKPEFFRRVKNAVPNETDSDCISEAVEFYFDDKSGAVYEYDVKGGALLAQRFARFERRTQLPKNDKAGLSSMDTFEFLGFTHYCGLSRKGYFKVKRQTSREKFRASLQRHTEWLKKHRHRLKTGALLRLAKLKLVGHLNYYSITDNGPRCEAFRIQFMRLLFKWLNRRSQRHSYTWEQYIQALAWVGWPLVRRVHDLSPLARSRP